MLLTYLGGNPFFVSDAFFGDSGFDLDVLSITPTELVVRQPETGNVTTVNGVNFALGADGNPTSGTVTSMSFTSGGVSTGSVTGISWSLISLVQALDTAFDGSAQPIANLFASSGSFTFDGSAATDGAQVYEDLGPVLELMNVPGTITGGDFSDALTGTAGNDMIDPGANDDIDNLFASAGNDTYDLSSADDLSFYSFEYGDQSGARTFSINTGTAVTTITGTGSSDSVVNAAGAYTSQDGGVRFNGTSQGDTFNVNHVAGAWLSLGGGAGSDVFNLTLAADSAIRLTYRDDPINSPTQGINANLGTGVVSNDGYGSTDQINITGTGRVELRGTNFDDVMTGSSNRDSFITERGNDTVDGGAGFDRIRYDRSGVDAVMVDLEQETATGTWGGEGFNHTLRNIEEVRGSRDGNDTILGAAAAESLDGRGGDDELNGRGGADTLIGGGGDDTMIGGGGSDQVVINASSGSATFTELADGSIQVQSSDGIDLISEVENFVFNDVELSLSDVQALAGGGVEGETIIGGDGDDTLDGTAGDDAIAGGAGDDSLSGGLGNDEIAGSAGDDNVDGGAGNDNLGGGQGNDTILGSENNDTIGGGFGNDQIDGGGGNDEMSGGPGNDTVIGGEGNDTIAGSFGSDSVLGNGGDDSLGGGTGRDTVVGGAGDDSIGGGEGDDVINGGTGNDFLAGGGRNDLINGGAGNDSINSGKDNDTITGGTGQDVFIFTEFTSGEVDTITDWTNGEDQLRLTGIENAPGSGLQGRVDALNITAVAGGVEISYDGHRIVLEGASVGDLGVEDFIFV